MTRKRDNQPVDDDGDDDAPQYGSSRAAILPVGEPTPAELAIINGRAPVPLTAERVFVFRLEISNSLLDSYSTQMDAATSLPNYVQDFSAGRALMNSHRTGGWGKTAELPLGRSFSAELIPRGVEGDEENPLRTSCVASYYMVRGMRLSDVSTDDVISGIEAGVITDGSVQFHGGEYICSIDGHDMYSASWEDCPHFPGGDYWVQDPDDEDTRTLVRCSALITNARAVEGSLVWKGACPSAMILAKAARGAAAGGLTTRIIRSLELMTGVRMVGRYPAGADAEPARASAKGGENPGSGDGRTITGDGMTLINQFADLIGARMPAESRKRIALQMVKTEGERVTPDLVNGIAVELTKRWAGRDDHDAAAVQRILDSLAERSEDEAAASDAIADLSDLGPSDVDDAADPGAADPDPAAPETTASAGVDDPALVAPATVADPGAEPDRAAKKGSKRAATPVVDDGATTDMRARLIAVRNAIGDLVAATGDDDEAEGDEARSARIARVRTEVAKPEHAELRAFLDRARDGAAHRRAVVDEMHDWGVRAQGARYSRALFDRVAATISTDEIESLRSDFADQAHRRFANHKAGDLPEWAQRGIENVGRQTVAKDPNAPAMGGGRTHETTARNILDLSAHQAKKLG